MNKQSYKPMTRKSNNSRTRPGAGDLIRQPREIKAKLDEIVVGQEVAKKKLSVAVVNHYARLANGRGISLRRGQGCRGRPEASEGTQDMSDRTQRITAAMLVDTIFPEPNKDKHE